MVQLLVRSIRTTTMVEATTTIRGVGFVWRDYNIRDYSPFRDSVQGHYSNVYRRGVIPIHSLE